MARHRSRRQTWDTHRIGSDSCRPEYIFQEVTFELERRDQSHESDRVVKGVSLPYTQHPTDGIVRCVFGSEGARVADFQRCNGAHDDAALYLLCIIFR